MNVVGHDGKFINFDSGIIKWDFVPNGLNHDPRMVQDHFSVHNIPEHTFPVLRADGDEIGPGL